MGRISPIKSVDTNNKTKDSTYKQKSQRNSEYYFRQSVKKAAMQKGKEQKRDTVSISEEGRKMYEEMKKKQETTKGSSLDKRDER